MVFFSKNRKSALSRLKKLAKQDKHYKNKTVVLASVQLPHINKWKTWKIKNK